jgi:RNA polymerase sigma-70 factor (ECF subfamily)
LTSETFFKALTKLGTFRWQNVPFSAWLYRIAGNEIADHFRKRKYRVVSIDKVSAPVSKSNPLAEFIKAEKEVKKHKDFLVIQAEISKLPFKYQEVITLRFFEKKKIREISEILGKREGTVKSLIHRGLAKLRTFIS